MARTKEAVVVAAVDVRRWVAAVSVLAVAVVSLAPSSAFGSDGWTITYGDPGPGNFSSANGVAVADDGSIYVMGPFFGQFGSQMAVDGFDVFLMKLTSAGVLVWTRSWDPGSMDGIDYSADLYDWASDAGTKGDVWIDGAGNIGITISNFAAYVDSSGQNLATIDRAGAPFTRVVGQMDSDGGLVALSGSDVTAWNADLQLEWGPVSVGSTSSSITPALNPLPDGGVLVVGDIEPEFAFQSLAQELRRIGPNGTDLWSVRYEGRCGGLASDDRIHAVQVGSTLSVLSVDGQGQVCGADLMTMRMSSYSVDTGVLQSQRELLPSAVSQGGGVYAAVSCGDASSAMPVVLTGWETPSCDDTTSTRIVSITSAFPMFTGGGARSFGLAALSSEEPEWENTPVLLTWTITPSAFTLESGRRLTDGVGSIGVFDVHVASDGSAVVVGRSDGSAVVPQGFSPTFGLSAVTEPTALVIVVDPSAPAVDGYDGSFFDDDGSVFESDIEWMASAGITKGCNPPVNDRFCPVGVVTRGQMAAFLVRALGLTDRLDNPFRDDDGSIFEADVERLAAAGITKGCNPPTNDRFCPEGKVTREQMAAFLVRALAYSDAGGGDLFVDDDDSIFEADIDRLATAGVTKGCNPPTNDRFCPSGYVTRGQMAAFLHRALG